MRGSSGAPGEWGMGLLSLYPPHPHIPPAPFPPSQGIKFFDPEIADDTPRAVELEGMVALLEAAGPHIGLMQGLVLLQVGGGVRGINRGAWWFHVLVVHPDMFLDG